MIRKLRKNVEQFQKNEEVALCATLIGSIIMSTGILTETPYEEQVKLFHKYANDCKELPTVIIDLVATGTGPRDPAVPSEDSPIFVRPAYVPCHDSFPVSTRIRNYHKDAILYPVGQ